MRKRVAIAAAIAAVVLTTASPAAAATPITGGGSSTLVAIIIDQWRADTSRPPYSLQVSYTSQGSSYGRQQFQAGNLDFGVSELRLQPGEATSRPFVYVPIIADGLAFAFNLVDATGQRITDLQLTKRAACKIFTGAITRWNDTELVATNPHLAGIDQTIRPFTRADLAGESYELSRFCITVAPDVWQQFVATAGADPSNAGDAELLAGRPVARWPYFPGAGAVALADGVANSIADPTGGAASIGYTAAGLATLRSLPAASVENAVGQFAPPTHENVTNGLAFATGQPDGSVNQQFGGSDATAYYPAVLSYALAPTTGFDPAKGDTLGQFLCYGVTTGQAIAPVLRSTRLSDEIRDLAIQQIVQIPGAPDEATCAAGAGPPPVVFEVPLAAALPVAAISIGGVGWLLSRRRRRSVPR